MTATYLSRLESAALNADQRLRALIEEAISQPEPDRSGYPLKKEPKLHHPDLDLSHFCTTVAAAPPPVVSHISADFAYGMLLNDQLGDCGDAMAIHGDETNHLAAGTPVPPYVDGDAEVLYEEVSDYNPNAPLVDGQNPTDTGTDNEKLVAYLRDPGLLCAATGQRTTITGSVFIDPGKSMLTRIGVWEFVVVYRAYGLPITAQTQRTWRVLDSSLRGDAAVGSWGYHDVPIVAYNRRGPIVVTWGGLKQVSWDFDVTYGVGGFATTNQDQLNNSGMSPSGLDWSALNAALAGQPSAPTS